MRATLCLVGCRHPCPAQPTHGKDGRGRRPNKRDSALLAGSCRRGKRWWEVGAWNLARDTSPPGTQPHATHLSFPQDGAASTWRAPCLQQTSTHLCPVNAHGPTCKPRVFREEAVAGVHRSGAAALRHLWQQGSSKLCGLEAAATLACNEGFPALVAACRKHAILPTADPSHHVCPKCSQAGVSFETLQLQPILASKAPYFCLL